MDREESYRRAREMLPGLLGSGRRREVALWTFAGISLLYAFVSGWRSSTQLASCKAEKQQGWVVLLDGKGERVNLPVVSADEWAPSDPLVVEKLVKTLQCLRGLDPVPKVVTSCWQASAKLFYGDTAVKQFDAFAKERIPSADAILQAQMREEIVVSIESWDKPDKQALPGRFWVRWTETHKPRVGQITQETWSGTFDVELVPMTKLDDPPLRIVRWSWRCDVGACKSKGAG